MGRNGIAVGLGVCTLLAACGAAPRAERLDVVAGISSGDAVQRGRTSGSDVDWQQTQGQIGAGLGAVYTASSLWDAGAEVGALRGRVNEKRGDAPDKIGTVDYLWAARLHGDLDGRWLGAGAALNVWWSGGGAPLLWPTVTVKVGSIGAMWGELRFGPDRLWLDANWAGAYFRMARGRRGGASVGLGAFSRQLANTSGGDGVRMTEVQPGASVTGWLPVGDGEVEVGAVLAESSRLSLQYRLPLFVREPKGARPDEGADIRADDLELTRPW